MIDCAGGGRSLTRKLVIGDDPFSVHSIMDNIWINIHRSLVLLLIMSSGIVCGLGGFLLACALCFFCYRRKLKQRLPPPTLLVQDVSKSFSKKELESMSFHCQTHFFSYEELVEATNGFDRSNELGDGGYGSVYKGNDGQCLHFCIKSCMNVN